MRAAWLGLVLVGCASATSLGSARTLEPGQWQGSLGAKALAPVIEGEVRRGMAPGVELGARVGGFHLLSVTTLSAAADVKVQLSRSFAGAAVSLVPGLGFESLRYAGAPIDAAYLSVPLLVGWQLGDLELVVGPRVIGNVVWDANSEAIPVLLAGASVGFLWRFSPHIRVAPEVSVLYTPSRVNAAEAGTVTAQVALGVLWNSVR